MPNIYADDYNKKPLSSGMEGNGYNESYSQNFTAAIGDKLYFGVIPAGIEISGLNLINDALASGTLSLGFEPVNDNPVASPTYWMTTQSLATAANTISRAHPIFFNEPVKLVGVLAGAALAGATKLTVITTGKGVGVR